MEDFQRKKIRKKHEIENNTRNYATNNNLLDAIKI